MSAGHKNQYDSGGPWQAQGIRSSMIVGAHGECRA